MSCRERRATMREKNWWRDKEQRGRMDFFFEEKIDRFDRWKRIIIVCVCVQINSFPFFFLNSKFYYINQIKDYPIVLIE